MDIKSCSNCDFCIQYYTRDAYPEFGCGKNRGIRLNGMCFPSEEKSCDQWEKIKTDKWKLR